MQTSLAATVVAAVGVTIFKHTLRLVGKQTTKPEWMVPWELLGQPLARAPSTALSTQAGGCLPLSLAATSLSIEHVIQASSHITLWRHDIDTSTRTLSIDRVNHARLFV